MFFIDSRVGSIEMKPLLDQHGIPTHVITELPFGDFAFMGNGKDGAPVSVGIERKVLQDFINSTLTGRFAGHQLPGLLEGYQDVWLIIEGAWRAGPTGLLEIPAGKVKGQWTWKPVGYGSKTFMYKELESLLLTLEIRGGVRLRFCRGMEETAWFLTCLYRWWTDKSLEDHKSHLRFRSQEADSALLTKPSLCRLMAKELPGIGWKKSLEVASHFQTVYAMAQAEPKDWEQVAGVGKTMAMRIWLAVRGMQE